VDDHQREKENSTTMTATTTPTWEQLTDAEPDLLRLEAQTRWMARRAGGKADADDGWYAFVKPQLVEMVGWDRGYPRTPRFEYDHDENGMLLAVQMSDPRLTAWLDAREKARPPAATEAERMLRGTDAYGAAYLHLCDLLSTCRQKAAKARKARKLRAPRP
jgi:hypothetical protein